MPMLNLTNNAAAAFGAAGRLLRQARDDVSAALLGVGFVTCVTAVRSAAASRPAAESLLAYHPVYLGALVASLVGGLSTMWAAVWVAGEPARRQAAGRIILCASFVPMLIVAVGLSNDLDDFFHILGAVA